MALFGRKAEETEPGHGDARHPAAAPGAQAPRTPAPAPAPAAPAASPRPRGPAFGIDKAVALMKAIPAAANAEATYMVVIRRTLEAVGVSVGDVLQDGSRRAEEVTRQIQVLQEEVRRLEEEAAQKTRQVLQLQAELEAISTTIERLQEPEQPIRIDAQL